MSVGGPLPFEVGFLLGDWEVRPRHGTVRRMNDPSRATLALEPRVMAVLVCLARHAGSVVTRDEFVRDVWGGRVVSDEALSRCISVLRQALADDSREPRYIRTIAKVGYALLVHPAALPQDALPDALPAAPAVADAATPSRSRLRGPARLAGAFVLVLAAAVGGAAIWQHAAARLTAPAPPVTRLLVLPFDTREAHEFGRDVGSELADEISDSLAHVGRLRIAGRTSAESLAAMHTGALDAGRKLGVDAVLDGAVSEQPHGLRVEVRLTATADGRRLWSRTYERRAEDIFAVESSIASAVVRELVGVLSYDGLAGVPSVEPESRDLNAYQLYLRAAHQLRLRGEDSLRLAIDLYSAAIRRDPGYARAYIGLASAYVLLPEYSYEEPAPMHDLAEKALARADQLSHNPALSAGPRAYLEFQRGHWLNSEAAFRTAIAADPNNPDLRQQYSQLLGTVGRLDAALAQAHLAQELDPLAPIVADRLGILHLWLGRDADAAADVALARELGLVETAYPETNILLQLHQHADGEAADALRRRCDALHRPADWVDDFIDAYRRPERRAAQVERLTHAHAAGEITQRLYFGAMVLLESPARALDALVTPALHDANALEFLFSADAAATRRDPSFAPFVQRIGLDAYWDRYGWPAACRRVGGAIACH